MTGSTKSIIKANAHAIMQRLPCGFKEYRERSTWRSPHVIYYSRESAALGLEFILWYVWPKPTKAAFTLEFGWSSLHRIPEISTGHFALDKPDRLFTRYGEREYIQRVGIFFGKDTWWDVIDGQNGFAAAEEAIRGKILPLLSLAESKRAGM